MTSHVPVFPTRWLVLAVCCVLDQWCNRVRDYSLDGRVLVENCFLPPSARAFVYVVDALFELVGNPFSERSTVTASVSPVSWLVLDESVLRRRAQEELVKLTHLDVGKKNLPAQL